jgi:hypothetical protein
MVQTDRNTMSYLGHFEFATDHDGRFAFANIAPMQNWYIYGLMDSLKSSGSIPVRSLMTQAHGSTLDLGDIVVQPGYRLTGRVVLSDGRGIPAGARVLVSRSDAWDSQTTSVDKDGRFSFFGLPAERVSLSTNLRGYHPSPRNGSFHLLNPSELLGTIPGDIEDLRFLFDPGPDTGYRRLTGGEYAEYERRRNRVLRGVSDGGTP